MLCAKWLVDVLFSCWFLLVAKYQLSNKQGPPDMWEDGSVGSTLCSPCLFTHHGPPDSPGVRFSASVARWPAGGSSSWTRSMAWRSSTSPGPGSTRGLRPEANVSGGGGGEALRTPKENNHFKGFRNHKFSQGRFFASNREIQLATALQGSFCGRVPMLVFQMVVAYGRTYPCTS